MLAGKEAMMTAPETGSLGLPGSKELAGLFQEEFVRATGIAARWAAERVQGQRRHEHTWVVPFGDKLGTRGTFSLHWDADLQRFLAGRLGANAARPEYLGVILRATAGRWADWRALRGSPPVRLGPSPQADESASESGSLGSSSAALIIDRFVLELVFALEAQGA
jgi:hypothetical protein